MHFTRCSCVASMAPDLQAPHGSSPAPTHVNQVCRRKMVAAGLRAQVEAERRAAAAEKPSMPTYGTAVRRAPSLMLLAPLPPAKTR